MAREPRRTIRTNRDFSEKDFPDYVFSEGRVYKQQNDTHSGKQAGKPVRPRKVTRGAKRSPYAFRLVDRFGEAVLVYGVAIFKNFQDPPPTLPPCVEDFPDYYFDEDGTPHRYNPPGRRAYNDPKGWLHTQKDTIYFRLKTRDNYQRILAQETLRRMVNGLPLRDVDWRTAYDCDPPPGTLRFTEFWDYAFHPDGRVFRITFPIIGETPRLIRPNHRGMVYIYDSVGVKRGFNPQDIKDKCSNDEVPGK